MRNLCMALLFAATAVAQNFSVTAVADGVTDVRAYLQRVDRLELVVQIPETQLTVLELNLGNFTWSYTLPPAPTLFRDGFIERLSTATPAVLRIPVDLIPMGTWHLRVGTAWGYSDTLQLRHYP